MDYSKLSDLEINGYVLHRLNQGQPTRQQQLSVASGEVDYCNNPADAWPIIFANQISIEFDGETHGDVPCEWVSSYAIDGLKVHVVARQPCDKALRSAMIVYLMMQEGK